jgi:hypothetical protein
VAKHTNGECYYCSEKFSNDHKCKSKSVFLLEMDDGDEPDVVTEDLGISLHMLTDIDVADMMKLHIQIHDQTIVALVETGSTHAHQGDCGATPRPSGDPPARADC